MTALIWKELRENFRWALLAMAGLGAAQWYALHESQYGMLEYYSYSNGLEGITLCKTAFLTVTTFGCAGAGLLLGLVQILPELGRDRWAALLHRPVSRGTIFRGKVAAGLLLYLLATTPPFLFSVWLVATPGHFSAPFVPGMVLPGTADICAGTAWYFAALALALQRGGWIGLRAFPLLAAYHAASFVTTTHFFYVAVEGAVLMSLALFTAAWGMIFHQEKLGARPWLGRFAFLAMVFYGACGLGDLTLAFLDVAGPSPHSTNNEYMLSDQGVPLLITYRDNVAVSVTDPEGKHPPEKKYQPDQVRNHVSYLNTFSSYIGDSHGWHPWLWPPTYRQTRSYIYWALSPYQYPRLEQWFWLTEPRYLIGYWPVKKEAMGILDQDGFEPMTATPKPFPPEAEQDEFSQDLLILRDKTRVRLASLPNRRITDLVLPAPGPVYGVSMAFANGNNGSVSVMGVTLATGLAIYDEKGSPVTMLPYDRDVEHWGQLELGINGALDRFYLWYEPSAWIDAKTRGRMPSYVEEMDAKGQVLHSYTLPTVPPFYRDRSWKDFLAQRVQSPAFFFGEMGYRKIGAWFGSTRLAGALGYQFSHDRSLTRTISHWISAVSLLLAGITLFWARRVHFPWPRAWAWAAFVFAFHLPGFITFRLASDWPQLVPCPACRKLRPTHDETCPHCEAGWPAPPREATEIFDDQSRPAPAATPA